MNRSGYLLVLALATVGATPSSARAQVRTLQVISSDSQPIVYAFVTLDGGNGQITDDKGEISLGAGKARTLTVNVRRIGYQQWFGKLEFPDTAAVLRVTLARIAQTLGEVRVSGYSSAATLSLPMKGFYDRWQMRQKGLLSATFIGPEEIESRHPDKITNMLRGLNSVTLRKSVENEQVAFGFGNQCKMAILVDGMPQCPRAGCGGGNNAQSLSLRREPPLSEMTAVLIDRILEANDVTAIEVYPRGGNMPINLQVADPGCGVIAFWTGSRKP